MPDTVVGRVYVEDPDDWDLPDKTFSWLSGQEYSHFQLDRDTGNITMRYGTPNGSYPLQFQVRTTCLPPDVTFMQSQLPSLSKHAVCCYAPSATLWRLCFSEMFLPLYASAISGRDEKLIKSRLPETAAGNTTALR